MRPADLIRSVEDLIPLYGETVARAMWAGWIRAGLIRTGPAVVYRLPVAACPIDDPGTACHQDCPEHCRSLSGDPTRAVPELYAEVGRG
jgi:hypothetical protein